MRDWALVLAPMAVAIYFLVRPDHFNDFLSWVSAFIQ
jgi:hypothetical protein